MGKLNDLTGQKFNRLTALSFYGFSAPEPPRYALWLFRCDCGKEHVASGRHVKSGHTKSCGCLVKDNHPQTHGFSKTSSLYELWQGMKARCTNPNHIAYKNYGGRGIKVCDRWINSFKKFLEDMGERPEGCSLDRIDNDKDYCKENCKWSTRKEQGRNKRTNVKIQFENDTYCLKDFCGLVGLNYNTTRWQLNSGRLTIDELIPGAIRV